MTPTQARAFLGVAIEGSFTGAAKRLNVSQPSVTAQVGLIERQYKVELFHRIGRGVQLTPAATAPLPMVRRLFTSLDEATVYLQDLRGQRQGYLRLGSYTPKPQWEFPRLCRGGSKSLTYPAVDTAAPSTKLRIASRQAHEEGFD
jgi:DNA-binding transcriptional LysR family regulator